VEVVHALKLGIGMALSTDQSSKVLSDTFRQSIEQLEHESSHTYLGGLVSLRLSIGQSYEVFGFHVREVCNVSIS
jgi:hypothetical protein